MRLKILFGAYIFALIFVIIGNTVYIHSNKINAWIVFFVIFEIVAFAASTWIIVELLLKFEKSDDGLFSSSKSQRREQDFAEKKPKIKFKTKPVVEDIEEEAVPQLFETQYPKSRMKQSIDDFELEHNLAEKTSLIFSSDEDRINNPQRSFESRFTQDRLNDYESNLSKDIAINKEPTDDFPSAVLDKNTSNQNLNNKPIYEEKKPSYGGYKQNSIIIPKRAQNRADEIKQDMRDINFNIPSSKRGQYLDTPKQRSAPKYNEEINTNKNIDKYINKDSDRIWDAIKSQERVINNLVKTIKLNNININKINEENDDDFDEDIDDEIINNEEVQEVYPSSTESIDDPLAEFIDETENIETEAKKFYEKNKDQLNNILVNNQSTDDENDPTEKDEIETQQEWEF